MFSSNTSQVEGGYQISRSLRFNSADSTNLTRTPASAGSRTTWTWSGWVKRSALAIENRLLSAAGTNLDDAFQFESSDKFKVEFYTTSTQAILVTTQVFRDPSAWYHIVVAVDTTQATASNRIKLYVNGSQVTAFDSSTYPSQNFNTAINNNIAHYIGSRGGSPFFYFSGYQTEINFIDGQALTPSSFGETNAQTGVWQPKAYSGSYGTNGFYLNFSDNSNTTAATLGKDYSGNGNNWTPNNFSVTAGAGNDSLVDTPTPYGSDSGAGGEVRGNYCTWSPVDRNPIFTLTNGNLDCAQSAADGSLRATIAVSSGKWYWEITVGTGNTAVGIALVDASLSSYLGGLAGAAGFNMSSGLTLVNTPFSSATGSSIGAFATNDIIGLALDFTDGTLKFYRNGTLITANHITNVSGLLAPAIGSNVATSGYIANFGQRPFAYTAPSGFKALCTQNLPTPTIGATTATQAGKFFNPVLWTGTGSTQDITGVGFEADFIWMKDRNTANRNHYLFDRLRGITNARLFSNLTDAENTSTTYINSTNSDGYQLAAGDAGSNGSGETYVGWNWKANGAGSSNTAGSITSTVSANTTSGFSIVRYNGTSANATIGHGLGVAPKMIIRKYVNDTDSWYTYHASLGADKYLALNETSAATTSTAIWQNTAPTSTVFSIGSGNNNSNSVAYCFAEVPGFSAFGSYTGNGSNDGPFVYCGFRPRLVMAKNASNLGSWVVLDTAQDPYNIASQTLNWNSAGAVSPFNSLDIVSNGFKMRNTNSGFNTNGDTYIFIAFAENPFKYSIAR